ncbi:hypothetical protein HYC85_008490 [Camellia sinensis]|uniref:EF-hand domain-containing protein n=1 Tax=Camellia sinensis TaxID=4442 RepID=A0A7J7HU88_CAMSI|nr:hypothetical protein HYC85_008490 [Camellia sinensis]
MPLFSCNEKKSMDKLLNDEELKNIFLKYDKNGDGRLCKEELKNAFRGLHYWIPGFRARQGLHAADVNHDGFVSEDEMGILVKNALNLGFTVS